MNSYAALHSFYLVELWHRYTGEATPLTVTDDLVHALLMAGIYNNQRERYDAIGKYKIVVRRCGFTPDGDYADPVDVIVKVVTANQVRVEDL